MFKFFSDAFKEVGHVVWPTTKETRVYMWYNVAIIIFMTLFLSLVGFGFRSGLQAAKQVINPSHIPTEAELEANQAAIEAMERAKFGIGNPEITNIETTDTNTLTPEMNHTETSEAEEKNTEISNLSEQTEDSTLPSNQEEVISEAEVTQNNQ